MELGDRRGSWGSRSPIQLGGTPGELGGAVELGDGRGSWGSRSPIHLGGRPWSWAELWSWATGAGAGQPIPDPPEGGTLGSYGGSWGSCGSWPADPQSTRGGRWGTSQRGDITPQVTSGTRLHVETPPEFLLSRYAIPIFYIHFRPLKGTAPRVRARGGSRRPEI